MIGIVSLILSLPLLSLMLMVLLAGQGCESRRLRVMRLVTGVAVAHVLASFLLLAIRLACDVAVAEAAGLQTDWQRLVDAEPAQAASEKHASEAETMVRMVLLRASELAWERQVLADLTHVQDVVSADAAMNSSAAKGLSASMESSAPTTAEQATHLAQMVFCIDVRSERYRRQLEHVTSDVQTLGFAGFWGVPIAWRASGEGWGVKNLVSTQNIVCAIFVPRFLTADGLKGQNMPRATPGSANSEFTKALSGSHIQG